MRRVVIFLALVLLAVAPLLVLATNVVLQTSLLRSWTNTKPESTFITYDTARSDFPGRIVLTNLVIRSRDSGTEWIARLGDARVEVSLLQLVKKRFHASSVRGSGFSFRLRERPEPGEPKSAPPAMLPPIEGFGAAPVPSEKDTDRPENPETWQVIVDDLAVGTSEVWVNGYRYQGNARTAGSFFLHPTMDAEVFPSRLEIASGSLRLGADPVVGGVSGAVACAIPRFKTREYPGNEIWKILRGRVQLGGDVESLRFLNTILSEPRRPRFGAGKGRLEIASEIGGASGSGALKLALQGVETRFGEDLIRSRVSSDLRAKRIDFAKGAADFSGSVVDIRDATVVGKDPTRGWWGRFVFSPCRLDMKSGVATLHIDARARDPRPILTMLDVEVGGLGKKLVKLEDLHAVADLTLAGKRLELKKLEAQGTDALVEGKYVKRPGATRGAFLVSKGILHVGIGIEGNRSKLRVLGSRKWFREETGRPSKTDGEPGDERAN